MGRVLVAMSGGVDSSVAAARLVAAGLEVVGVTLHLWDTPDDGSVKGRCCAPEDVHDARRVADALGIAHYSFDRREQFRREVVSPFVDAYLAGETPSPCVTCNRSVKMHELLSLADRLDADAVATGHYARVDHVAEPPRLLRARDREKDQSYFLHMLDARALARLRFPLGEATKPEVRAEAARLGLPGATKGESQELCFVPSGHYAEFVAREAGERAKGGVVVDERGRVLGEHDGVHRFTIGQRKNLRIAVGRRAYVVDIDAVTGKVTLGEREQLASEGAVVEGVTLAADVTLPIEVGVAVRYRAEPVPAIVEHLSSGEALVRFRAPVSAVVPGQFAVFYQGERVLGGGRIARAVRARATVADEVRA
ncbi:MAG: tRNA 2-thiouridine(34) synthase MnmA [Sorangiineae bacterium]|nr:tRNA 2-thiouridine(34) synthase MnmA [Polyangiaceae bacterium]MEB2322188.1 tRNA 2-thiouridine(34) synthase MnmA [Sorangiineae bacterium]